MLVLSSAWPLLLATCTMLAVYRWWSSEPKAKPAQQNLSMEEKPWEYPEPSPDLSYDLEKTEPPHFRAFRYHYKRHTIEISPCDKNSFVKLDNEWPRYHRAKVKRLAARGNKVVRTLPPAQAAAHELCQDLCEFLSRRYPQIYKIRRSSTGSQGWYGEGSITNIEMPALNASYDLTKEDPLTVAGLIQPTDINILTKHEDGFYHLDAMMIAIGGGQRIKDKIGKNLADLHFSGHVPHYAEQLRGPLDKFLAKLKAERPVQRNTTGISMHDELHWPEATMGPEDDWDPEIGGPGVNTPGYQTWKRPGPISDVSQLWFRQERQVLRRLPKSKAIVWMVHTYIEPMAKVAQEPGVPGRLASLVRSWDPINAQHKGRHQYEHVLLPYLDDLHRKQVDSGIVQDGELSSRFPY